MTDIHLSDKVTIINMNTQHLRSRCIRLYRTEYILGNVQENLQQDIKNKEVANVKTI